MSRLLLLVLAGCNQLLDLGEPSLDDRRPSCETGWSHRTELSIENAGDELHDFQISFALPPVDLAPDFGDLRFTTELAGLPLRHTVERGRAWVNVPRIPTGSTALYLHHGNLAAAPLLDSPFERDIIINNSFEDQNGWTAEPAIGPAAAFLFQHPSWATDGAGSLLVDENVNGERAGTSRSAIHQPMTFPPGSNYVLRFDLNVIAASNGGINGTNNGAFLMTLGNGLTNLYVKSGDQGIITGEHLDEETFPFGPGTMPITIEVRVASGGGTGYAKGHFDNLRVRKHALPEPTVAVVAETACD